MTEQSATPSHDAGRPTISRLMVLMAGIGLGLTLFHEHRSIETGDVQWWRGTLIAVLIGCSLPGVLYTTRWRPAEGRHGIGSLEWLTLSLGAWLMVPPTVAGPLLRDEAMGSDGSTLCLYYTMPLVSLWFTLAAIMSGQLRGGGLNRNASWGERFGWWLGLAWSVLGVWLLFDFYAEAFFQGDFSWHWPSAKSGESIPSGGD